VPNIKALLSVWNLRPQEQGTTTELNLPGRTTCWPAYSVAGSPAKKQHVPQRGHFPTHAPRTVGVVAGLPMR
jgi:hypothetical protein